MQGISFWRTPEFWTAVLTVIAAIVSHFSPDWKTTLDEIIPQLVIVVIALITRTTIVQLVQFRNGYSFDDNSRRWKTPSPDDLKSK